MQAMPPQSSSALEMSRSQSVSVQVLGSHFTMYLLLIPVFLQDEAVIRFSQHTNMNLEWSKRYEMEF